MNADFYNQIAKSNASTDCRNNLKELVLDNPNLLVDLVQMAINISDKNNHKAVWIVEMIAETDTLLLQPFLTDLIESFSKHKHESAIRGMSRVAYFIATSKIISTTENQNEKIIEYCLDGLIGAAKVAPKVYNMYTLSFYTAKYEWLKEELKNIIEKDFATQSAGYKAAAREVLRKI
ncbi:hypothetical protein [Flavobacterium sp.]|uniref:hypothetical protein n=1 Tax=Flavobacterium sp. TaxID=239 RepID=UPI00375369C7